MCAICHFCSYRNNVEENLLVQICIGFTTEQIEVAMTSKFVAMATLEEANNLKTSWGMSLFLTYFFLTDTICLDAIFKKKQFCAQGLELP